MEGDRDRRRWRDEGTKGNRDGGRGRKERKREMKG